MQMQEFVNNITILERTGFTLFSDQQELFKHSTWEGLLQSLLGHPLGMDKTKIMSSGKME